MEDYYEDCLLCGDPIDYCQGHGTLLDVFEWENIYSDLIALTVGEFTGYVELFLGDNGMYNWEILKDATVMTVGSSPYIETAKRAVERRLL